MKKFTLLLLLAVIFVAASCGKKSIKVDQNKIFQNYKAIYDANANETTFYAHFYENNLGGKSLKLSEGSTVTLDGYVMTRIGTVYRKVMPGNVSGTFVFKDLDGNEFTNVVVPAAYIGNDPISNIYNGSTTYWEWAGGPVGIGEEVSVEITNNADTSLDLDYNTYTVGAYYITMSGSSMSGMPDGYATARTRRDKSINTGNYNLAGGQIDAAYISFSSYVYFY